MNLSLSTKDKGGRKHKCPQPAVNTAEKAADLGMTNVCRSAHPDGGVPHAHRSQNPGVPDATTDHVLTADKRRQVVRGAPVDCHPRRQPRSDHAAVLAVLDVHATAGHSPPGEGRGTAVRRVTAEVGDKESDKKRSSNAGGPSKKARARTARSRPRTLGSSSKSRSLRRGDEERTSPRKRLQSQTRSRRC